MKSTGAVCETKAGDRRPGRGAPSGGRDPGEARVDAAENVVTGASARNTASAAGAVLAAAAGPGLSRGRGRSGPWGRWDRCSAGTPSGADRGPGAGVAGRG